MVRWAYGVMTVPARRADLLPATLASLARAGFDRPRLFVDGCPHALAHEYERFFSLSVTARWPAVLVAPNWILSAWELYVRDKDAAMYAVFQDDLLTVRDLRAYLEKTCTGPRQYWNLFTNSDNQAHCRERRTGRGWDGWWPSNGRGQGAVALVFTRQGMVDLLGARHLADARQDGQRWYRCVDGSVVEAMRERGYVEMVHRPSLVQHTGRVSVMDKWTHSDGRDQNFAPYVWPDDGGIAPDFPDGDVSALTFLGGRTT